MSEREIVVRFGADISDFRNAMSEIERDLNGVRNQVGRGMNGVQSEVESSTSGIKQALKGIGAAIVAAFAVDAIIGFGKTVLETAADIQALESQYSQVMAGMKDVTDKYLDEMSAKWNKHPNELKSAYMQYVAILKSKGIAEKDAHDIAKQTLDRTVDANAFANESMADTVARFMGGIKGEYDSLDTAMVNLSATMLNDMAVKEYGKKFDELTVAQQEQLKVQEMLRQHTSAGVVGQGAREAESYQNSLAMLKNTWNELIAAFGAPVLSWVGEKLSFLTGILNNIDVEAITSGFSSFGEYLGNVFGPIIEGVKSNFNEFMGFMENSGAIDGLKTALDNMKVGFQWFVDNLPNVTTKIGEFIDKWDFLIAGIAGSIISFSLINFGIGLFTTIIGIATFAAGAFGAVMAFITSPIGIVVIAIGALIAIGILLYKNWGTIVNWLGTAWDWLKEKAISVWNGIKEALNVAWNAMKTAITNTWNGIKTFLSNTWNGVKSAASSAWSGIKSTISNLVQGIKDKIVSVWNTVKEKTTSAWNGVKSGVKDAIEGIKTTISGLWTKAKEIAGKIKGAVGGMFEGIKTPHFSISGSMNPLNWPSQGMPKINVDWYATGGIATGPSVVGIGEAGDEAIVPLSNKSRMRPFAEAIAGMMGGSTSGTNNTPVNVTLNYSGNATQEDAQAMLDFVSRGLAKELGHEARIGGMKLR